MGLVLKVSLGRLSGRAVDLVGFAQLARGLANLGAVSLNAHVVAKALRVLGNHAELAAEALGYAAENALHAAHNASMGSAPSALVALVALA